MFEPFQNFVKKAAKRYGVDKEVTAAKVCHDFVELIPQIFYQIDSPEKFITAGYFRNGQFVVKVNSPAWGQEVIMRKPQIIEELNKKAGKKIIKSLRTEIENYR